METQPLFMFSVIWVSAGRCVLIWTSCRLGTANNLKYKIISLQYRLVHIVQYNFMKTKPTAQLSLACRKLPTSETKQDQTSAEG